MARETLKSEVRFRFEHTFVSLAGLGSK